MQDIKCSLKRRSLVSALTTTLLLPAMTGLVLAAPLEWPLEKSENVVDHFGVQLKGGRDTTEVLDKVDELGMRWVRRGFIWEAIEKEKGIYDFSKYDRFVKDCQDRGLNIVGCLAFSNKLYGHAKDPEGRAGYAKWAAALAAHYKDAPIAWEIWNEPNTKTFWGSHEKKGNSESYAEQYYNLMVATVPAMKEANPNAYIMGGSVSNLWTESYKWQDFIFADGALKTGIDGWSVHPYGLKAPEDYIEGYKVVRNSMEKAGGPMLPLINTERGYPIGKAEGHAGGDPALALEYQAAHLVRQYMIDLYLGAKATIWYEWDGKEGFNLVNPDGSHTPAYNAAKVLIQQLDGFKYDKAIRMEKERDFAFQFSNKEGKVTLLVWTAPPPMQPADKTEPHTVKIPVGASGTLSTATIYGEKGSIEAKDDAIEIELTGAPQYVFVK